ncbi:CAP domain-containing protein [Segnochrobactraceae bacterium EtOH-i3]
MSIRKFLLPAALVALALASCAEPPARRTIPPFYQDLASPGARIDTETAARFINNYRANKGLPPVTIDPRLDAIAADQVRYMGARNDVASSLENERQTIVRLKTAGVPYSLAVENVSAGYRTFAEAFSGWRDSPVHNANMLNPAVRTMGIATAFVPGSKYKVFWSLILVAPPK